MNFMLLRSPEDIIKSLILPQDYIQVASLLCSVFILLEFKFNSCQFVEDIGIKESYTQVKGLQVCLKTQKNEENTTCIYQINYIGFLRQHPSILVYYTFYEHALFSRLLQALQILYSDSIPYFSFLVFFLRCLLPPSTFLIMFPLNTTRFYLTLVINSFILIILIKTTLSLITSSHIRRHL